MIQRQCLVNEGCNGEQHYQSLVEKLLKTPQDDLSNSQQEQINALLVNYAHYTSVLGHTNAVTYHI